MPLFTVACVYVDAMVAKIWQFSSHGFGAGRAGNTDVNAFGGSKEELYALFYGKEG